MDSQMSMKEIDELVLIGGSGKMPMISKFLEIKTGKKPIVIGSLWMYVQFIINNTILNTKFPYNRIINIASPQMIMFKRTMGTDKEYKLGIKKYSSEELSAFVLKSLKLDAERFLKKEVEEAVISVPAYFGTQINSYNCHFFPSTECYYNIFIMWL